MVRKFIKHKYLKYLIVCLLNCLIVINFFACSDINKTKYDIPQQRITEPDTISVVEIDRLSGKLVRLIDRQYTKVPKSSIYRSRLELLSEPHKKLEERQFNFGVYLSPEVEVLGFPDGSIRISSGLMDMFTDQELIWLLLEEIQHITYGHTNESLASCYTDHYGGRAISNLSSEDLLKLINLYGETQYSFARAVIVDEATTQKMLEFNYNLDAAPSALFKLAVLGNNHNLTAKQPEARKRAQKLLVRNLMLETETQTTTTGVITNQAIQVVPETLQYEVSPKLIRESNWQLRTGWYIEAAILEDQVQAETQGESFKLHEISQHVAKVTVADKDLFLLLLGPYFEYDIAKEILSELRDSGKLTRDVRVVHVGH